MARDRILFLSSNGTGLGHLTRSMAIARRLDPRLEPLFFTLSGAAPVVAQQGFEVEFAASYATPTAGSDWRWSRRLRGRLRAAMRDADPRVMVFDGAHPYQALLDAMPSVPDAHRVWCRRPMWKPGSNFGALERTRFFDRVLEPGEFAAPEDRGATVALQANAHCVDPVVFLDDSELLGRAEAERELGFEPGGVNVLVQLGQGAEVRAASERCLAHLAGVEGVRVAALRSHLAAIGETSQGVIGLEATYPMSRYLRAFDASVSAAGYNAYHELIRFEVPSLFVPMRRQTDDQEARARFAESSGVGRGVSGPSAPELEAKLGELLDRGAREAMRAALSRQRPANGAGTAARWLADLAATERVRKPAAKRWKRYAAHPVASARAAAPFAARVPGAVGRIAHQTITRPSARTVIDAQGLGPDEVSRLLPGALESSGEDPARVLVLTDRPEVLPVLRGAGVGGEHVTGPGRRDLILAERPRIRRLMRLDPAIPSEGS
ncbi:MAG: UDP-N-acetylglucosamine--LPS N-acetylglucosamine transferase [Actinomycetota bacterium]|nr:UDP-N-acetylglucosamine--LPS N-acetylglucosamine transferase [Actinomycetota bacterium]